MILSHFESNVRFLCTCLSRIQTESTKQKKPRSILCPQNPAGINIYVQLFCGDTGVFLKKFQSHGYKPPRRALGCPEGVGFRIMARKRMATLLKYAHFEAISCDIITYFMTCQNFTIRKQLCSIVISHPWPSDKDLAYTMASAISKYTG